MKALLLKSPREFAVVERPDPVCGPDDALVRVHRSGICATDVATIEGHSTVAVYPITPGHEFAGRIESAPAGSGFASGDWVTIYPTRGCGGCAPCRAGRPNHCREFKVLGVHRDGGSFAERIAVPVDQLIRLPPSLQNELGALVEPLAVGVHANRRAGVREDPARRIAVIGAGTVGAMVAQVARAWGAADIVVADRLPARESLMRSLGFERFLLTGDGELGAPLQAFGGPLQLVFDNVCSRQTLAGALQALEPGGTLVLLGFPHDDGEVPLRYSLAYQREVSVLWSRNYVRDDFTDAIDLLERGSVDGRRMITGTWPLTGFDAAYAELRADPARHVKVMIAP
ncbi:MAG: zinc-binding dehydrogenase [Lautropia sp.]